MKNWEVKTLGDIGKVSMCKRVFKEDTLPTGDIPFYKIGTFGKEPNAYITKERYDEFRRKFSFPKKGDILISASGTIGRCVRYDGEPAYFQDSNIVWIDNDEKNVLNSFLYRFYEVCNWGSTKGATIARLYNSNLKQIEIAYPKSLHEQQRIVAILDEAFAAIAKAKANAEQNLKNAKELFESYLQDVFENKGEGWEEKTLGGIYDVRDGTHDSPKYQEEGFPLITSKNLKKDLLNYDNVKYISEQDYININKRSKVDKGDILFAMIGTIGNPVVIKDEPDFAIKNVALFKVPNSQNSNFLKYFLDAKSNIDKMMGDAKGTTQKFVGLGYLRAFKILLPPLKDQQIIVRKLDALSLETKKLEAIYQQKINDLEELKKSVLQKAFAGELKEDLKEHFAENA